MPARLYVLTVLGAPFSWMLFGMSVGEALRVWDAGATPSPLQLVLVAIWLLLGIGDVWWLLRFRPAPTGGASGGVAPAT